MLFVSIFSFGTYAQETADATIDAGTSVTFSEDVAGITPDSFWYFFDFTHTTEEAIHEMGLMAEIGDYDSYRQALENFDEAVTEEITALEATSLEGVTIEAIESDSHEGVNTIVETQINTLTYEEYADAIEEIFEEQVESGEVSEEEVEELVDELNAPVNELGSEVEHATQELYDTAGDNSGVSEQEVTLVYEDNIREQVGDRFNEIASIQNVVELDAKIAELEQEISDREATGDTEGVAEVRSLLDLARSHGENCLNNEENNFDIEGVNHINAEEDIIYNVERYIDGELSEEEYERFITLYSPLEEEEIREQIEDNNEDATKFIENYEELRERYIDNPEKLAYIEQEKARSEKVEELTEKLSDEGVLDSWFEDLRAEGLSEEDIIAEVHERWVDRYELANGHYTPPGTMILPGDDATEEASGEEIPIGRIERVERIDAETGLVTIEYVGWHDGEFVDVEEGGGFALGVPYEYDGFTYTYGVAGYSVVADEVTYTFGYPTEGYTPEEYYNYGDEAVTFTTENGDTVTYSPTGYEIETLEGELIAEDAYTQEVVNFADGSSLDNEATGFVFNDNDGEAYVYGYNTEIQSYSDITTGKIYVPPTPASHIENTFYDSLTGTYKYNYAGVEWTTTGDGTWTNPTGQQVNLPTIPAPVGYEDRGSWTTPSGKIWNYDSATNTWTETTSGSSYVPAPNNWYRYDEGNGRYIDNHGNRFDSSGEGDGYRYAWNYDSASKQWVRPDNSERYDPTTGNIIKSDGTIVGPENRAPGEGSEGVCYGCYYQGGQSPGTSGSGQWNHYTYDYGSHYERDPFTGAYNYVDGNGQYQGATSTTDAQGNVWSRNVDGSWSSSTGQTYSPGQYAVGAGSYTGAAIGTTVVGDDGRTYTVTHDKGWTDAQGNAVPPPTVGGTQQPSSAVGGGYYGGSGYSGSGYYTGGGGYNAEGNYVGGEYGGYDSSGNYVPGSSGTGGSYPGYYGGYVDSSGVYHDASGCSGGGCPSSPEGGTYGGEGGTYGGEGGTYGGEGGTYGGEGGTYGGTYGGYYGDGGSYTGGSYTGGDSGGTTSGGSYTGGDSGGSTTGGDSGGSTGGDSGGSTTGGDSGGSTTGGAVIAEEDSQIKENFVTKFFKWVKDIFG